jgi:predicted nucleic acid-binding protein
MNYLLDTNIVSEWTKPRPNVGIVRWLDEVDEDRIFLSVVTVAEVRFGIDVLPAGARRTRLAAWLSHDLIGRFEGRILPVDAAIADRCGHLLAHGRTIGRPFDAFDALLAATASCHHLTLITRNVHDFELAGTLLYDPWTDN